MHRKWRGQLVVICFMYFYLFYCTIDENSRFQTLDLKANDTEARK